MFFSLCKVEGRLQKAFSRAKKYPSIKLGSDIGHRQALKQADAAKVVLDRSRFAHLKKSGYGHRKLNYKKEPSFRRGWLVGKWVKSGPDLFDQKKVWTIRVPDQDEYAIFLWKARLYLVLRGIPRTAKHKTATEEVDSVYAPQFRFETWKARLTVQEEALRYAGIPLDEPSGQKYVHKSKGIIKSPAMAKVVKAYVKNPPKNGGSFVNPYDALFLLEVWTKPRVKNNMFVRAPVGGSIDRVLAKVGDWVEKDQALIHLRDPWEKVYTIFHLSLCSSP